MFGSQKGGGLSSMLGKILVEAVQKHRTRKTWFMGDKKKKGDKSDRSCDKLYFTENERVQL